MNLKHPKNTLKNTNLVTHFALYETCDIFYVKRLAAAAPSFTAFLCPNNLLQPCQTCALLAEMSPHQNVFTHLRRAARNPKTFTSS